MMQWLRVKQKNVVWGYPADEMSSGPPRLAAGDELSVTVAPTEASEEF